MPIRLRKKVWVIPGLLYLNASNSGLSWTVKVWRWSRNSRTKRARFDLPGPFSWVGRSKRQRAVARQKRDEQKAAKELDRVRRQKQREARTVQERERWRRYWSTRATVKPAPTGSGGKSEPVEGVIVNREQPFRRARLCGRMTEDGTPCQRPGKCPPGYHHHKRRRR